METLTIDQLKSKHDSAYKYRERRHEQWRDNYSLYRDTIVVDRVLQRQSVNVPLMKETIKTQLSALDDAPDIYFENQDNDKQAELYFNEYSKYRFEQIKLPILDMVDKKQELLYGRSFIKLNMKDGHPTLEVIDPQDILIDRYVDPSDIESAAYMEHTGIYRSLGELEQNREFDPSAIRRLKVFYGTKAGLIKADSNAKEFQERQARLDAMGVPDAMNPLVGDVIVELKENYVRQDGDVVVYTIADSEILSVIPLKKLLKVNWYPFVTWADDVEKTDFWSDGTADIARVPNQIANVWLSQLVENRTLRNYGMTFFNSSTNWTPSTLTPQPWGFYGIPAGDKPIGDVLQRVDVPELSESLDELAFVIQMAEKATAATAIAKGESDTGTQTLGEIEIIAKNAAERLTSTAKYYKQRTKDLGEKWAKLCEANASEIPAVKLFKKSAKGNVFEARVKASDWKSKAGYTVRVTSAAEREKSNIQTLQKLQAVQASFPGNQALDRIAKKKKLDLLDLTPEEVQEVMQSDEQAQKMAATMPMMGQPVDNQAPMANGAQEMPQIA